MLLKPIFVDTSAWIALYNKNDNLYEKAQVLNKDLLSQGYRYITTNFILDETYTGLLYRAGHHIAVEFGKEIRKSKEIEIIYITREIENSSWEMFEKYSDKKFSYTDCTSFVILRNLTKNKWRSERNIFTSDAHFKQVGYEILL